MAGVRKSSTPTAEPDCTMPAIADGLRRRGGTRRLPPALVIGFLIALVLLALIISITMGAAGISFRRLMQALRLLSPDNPSLTSRDQLILGSIRAPRIVVTAIIGAALAAAGASMQGLFRNPLADPALVGVASGGALAAAATIVLADSGYLRAVGGLQFESLPLAAFAGSLCTTLLLYRLASRRGRTSTALFLLTGIALAALANAGIGLLVFLADDRQLRDITFWLLGSFSGATWPKAFIALPVLTLCLCGLAFIGRGLDLLALGETEAFHAGVNVQRLKTLSILLISAMTGIAVSIAGVIGFVGIIAPHVLRLAIGPGHRLLIPASALLGAALLVGADSLARTLAAPAEIPIGVLTAAVGAPVFLAILLRQRARIDI